MGKSMLQTISRAAAVSVVLAALAGCGGGGGGAAPTPTTRVASRLTITGGNNQSGTVGEALASPLVVRVDDQYGTPLAGVTITWTITAGGGTVDHASSMTASDGNSSARLTLGMRPGANSLSAAAGGLPPAAFSATGTAGPLARLTITTNSASVETGDVVQLSSAAQDVYGNAVPLPALTWGTSDSGLAWVTADGFMVALGPGAVSVTATGGGVTGSLPLTINAGITFSFGQEETVFTWQTDRCENLDLPDVPAHVARLADNSLVLIAGDAPRYYASFGPDFTSLQRNCAPPALVSGDNYYPDTYDNQEWLHSIYREGNTLHALIHNEYHDPFAANCSPGNTSPGNPCWYNSITYASSTDGGHTFTHATPPAHVVAPAPVRWDPTGPPPPNGYFNPSNIVQGTDTFYYSIFMAINRSGNQALCVMRTQSLADPTSWRAWDGAGFNLQMRSPYSGPDSAMCNPVGVGQTNGIWGSLTYNTYLEKYMLVGTLVLGGPTEHVCGAGYSLSSDLITWSRGRFLRPWNSPWVSDCWPPESTAKAYPSIIDPQDAAVNFERPGRTPYLYFTRFNNPYLDRDLVRVPITITAH